MFVYGPVPSRRLGRSLGVSIIPSKMCSYSCIYCQLGRTTIMKAERESPYVPEDIMKEIVSTAEKNAGNIDYITFAGDGEPTLNKDLGYLIGRCNEELKIKTAVLTNGSMLSLADVRSDLMKADAVNVTFSAPNTAVFEKLHRPHKNIFFEKVREGVNKFAEDYSGRLMIEVMLVDKVNTDREMLISLRRIIDEIKGAEVLVMIPTRPPCEAWAVPPDEEKIAEAINILNGTGTTEMEIGEFGLAEFCGAEEAITEISARHPLRVSQAEMIADKFGKKSVQEMIAKKLVKSVLYRGERFIIPMSLSHESVRSGKEKRDE
jgi:wyosine [tRNA(Phe)-imidazoG37] synthetase (radical SAM superfamily)